MTRLYVRPALSDELVQLGYATLLSKPGFHPQMCRAGILDGRIVSHVLVEHHLLTYGSVQLKTAGIGRALTEPYYRGRGYATAVMQDVLTYMIEQHAHIALLDDPAGFFGRFGFYPVWPRYRLTFDSAAASQLPTTMTVRAPQLSDVPFIAHLYQQQWSGRVTYKREPEMWAWRLSDPALGQILVVVDETNHPQGYIYGHDLFTEAVEIVALTPDAALALMATIGRVYHQYGIDRVCWPVLPDDFLALFAPQVIDCTLSAEFRLRTGWMARIVDLSALIQAILPELLKHSGYSTDTLSLHSYPDAIVIHADHQCRINHPTFIKLLFGSLSVKAAAHLNGWTSEVTTMMQRLFPARVASLGYWDWF